MKYKVGDKVRYLGDIYVVTGGISNDITTLSESGEEHSCEKLYDLRPSRCKTEDDWDWQYDIPEADIEPYYEEDEEENDDDYDDDDEYWFASNSRYLLENGTTATYNLDENALITSDGVHIPARYYDCSGDCKLSSELNISECQGFQNENDKKDLSLKSDNGEYEINIKTTPYGVAVYGNFPENLEKDLSDIIKKMGDLLND